MAANLNLKLDRTSKTSLVEQIRLGINTAINAGVLIPGAKLPSWLDLAAQLGVSRGTVKAAYDRLADAQLIVSSPSKGTRVADHLIKPAVSDTAVQPILPMRQKASAAPAIFQMGVPAPDRFPIKLFARIRAHAARAEVAAPAVYPDPHGEPGLRGEVAAHLALSRGIQCSPSQVFITAGFSAAFGIVLRALDAEGRTAWVENPCFPPSRRALELSRLSTVPIPVDEDGVDVSYGLRHAPDAALALVTPGQQAPLGATLSLARRVQLIEWATQTGAWIIEDDYLGELQLRRRAAPGLASLDRVGRVIHIGSFSKTISPTLRLGFVVVPPSIVQQFAEVIACLAPAPGPAVQLATAEFMRDGHYLRHLRRMKRIYTSRGDALRDKLKSQGFAVQPAGLAVLLHLPEGARDDLIARQAAEEGLAPAPLSDWYSSAGTQYSGLLFNAATVSEDQIPTACERMRRLIDRFA